MNIHDYVAQSGRTISDRFHAEVISPTDAILQVQSFESHARQVDKYKKALFYGKEIKPDVVAVPEIGSGAFNGDELHAILGIITEVGEISEVLRVAWQNPNPEKDDARVADELGDLFWYIAILLRSRGLNPEKVLGANIAKLYARFPDKFDATLAISKDDAVEAEALKAELK